MKVLRMSSNLGIIWEQLEKSVESGIYCGDRVYQRLDLQNESGLRISMTAPEKIKELLIEIHFGDVGELKPPKWRGMQFETLTLDVPKPHTKHISICLQDAGDINIFTTVCSDIADTLENIGKPENRTIELQKCLDGWTDFFEKYGSEGLSKKAQRGLYGELMLLERLIQEGMTNRKAVESWQGNAPSYYDFENEGNVIEVKTTIGKEPRKVWINNERQLDNDGLKSLKLYVLSLHPVESGARTLPEQVELIRERIKKDKAVATIFESMLKNAGYLDAHAELYFMGHIIKHEETFNVVAGFPRITSMPDGLGDLKYTLLISACREFEEETNDAIANFFGDDTNGR